MSRKNKAAYNAYMAKYMTDRYHRRRSEAMELLGGRCVECGTTENLEFDHDDRTLKSFDLAKAFSSMSDAKLKPEIAKCKLRCRKHHTKKSIHELGNQEWKHGTLSGYRHCKCILCKKANSDYMKRYKKSRSLVA